MTKNEKLFLKYRNKKADKVKKINQEELKRKQKELERDKRTVAKILKRSFKKGYIGYEDNIELSRGYSNEQWEKYIMNLQFLKGLHVRCLVSDDRYEKEINVEWGLNDGNNE